jgi:hypothetical protein
MTDTLGSSVQTQALNSSGDTFYILTDNMNKKWTSDKSYTTSTTGEKRNIDIATDSSGNTTAVWEDERNSQSMGTWATADTTTYNGHDAATLMNNGKVLVTGGANAGSSIAEIYDPVTDTWSTAGTMAYGRGYHSATLLNNGKVLVSGQDDIVFGDAGMSIAETYDPSTNTWSTAGTSAYRRFNSVSTLLNNGHVLVTGQSTFIGDAGGSIAEIYDPVIQQLILGLLLGLWLMYVKSILLLFLIMDRFYWLELLWELLDDLLQNSTIQPPIHGLLLGLWLMEDTIMLLLY